MKPSLAIAGALLFLLQGQAIAGAEPDPSLSPHQAVSLQLAALGNNDLPVPDSGIAVAYAFASPANQEATGPLANFAQMIHQGYAAMLNFRSVAVGEPRMEAGTALVPVELTQHNGSQVLYLFIMSRHALPDCEGCWLTDAVLDSPQGPDPDSERST